MNIRRKAVKWMLAFLCLLAFLLSTTVFAEAYEISDSFTITTDRSEDYEVKGDCIVVKSEAKITVSGTGYALEIEADAANVEITLDNYVCERPDNWSGPAILLRQGASAVIHLKENTVNTLKGGPEEAAVRVPKGTSLTIDGTGTLRATARSSSLSSAGTGAAIGGNIGAQSGTITINGGIIDAVVEYHHAGNGAAIGGGTGSGKGNGRITITGGVVTATAAGNGAAIGGGGASSYPSVNGGAGDGGEIMITGGTVVCNGNIGGGKGAASQGTLRISGDANVSTNQWLEVNTTVSSDSAKGTIHLTSDMTIPAGKTLVIPKGITLDIPENVEIINSGTIINHGIITGGGKINNSDAENNLSGSGIEEGVTILPICEHIYGEWITDGAARHKKECIRGCGKVIREIHSFSGSACTVCGETEMPPYVLEDTTLVIYKDLENDTLHSVEWYDFERQVKHIIIGNGVTKIPRYAFDMFREVESIHIPESVLAIEAYAFPFDRPATIYCPETARDVMEAARPLDHVLAYYKMEAEYAVITAITDGSVLLPERLYGKQVYLSDGLLAEYPDVVHPHRTADSSSRADQESHYFRCLICETDIPETHTGGVATCHSKAVCTVCGNGYGEIDPSHHGGNTEVRGAKSAACTKEGYTGDIYCMGCGKTIQAGTIIPATGHTLSKVDAKPATEAIPGNKEYYQCSCGMFFADAAGTVEITDIESMKIPVKDIPQIDRPTDAIQDNPAESDQNKNTTTIPKSGDTRDLTGWSALLLLAGISFLGTMIYKKRT
ncbi:hypothetical protein [Hominifimenecus sp. rT4P-3]|uniref:hypothetical protein n=1 Tax=Hominifimenecus sp. rT4P-3 TaxID=3242979 RepID=UPI003DA44B11